MLKLALLLILCSFSFQSYGEKSDSRSTLLEEISKELEHGFHELKDVAKKGESELGGLFKSLTGAFRHHDEDSDEEDDDEAVPPRKKEREPLEGESDEDDDSSSIEVSSHSRQDPFGLPGFFNLFNIAGISRQKPWWKGPNVCVIREEIDESQHNNETDHSEDFGDIFGNFQFSSCQQTDTKYICSTKVRNHGIRKTFTVKHQCCHGYQRVQGKPGCTEVNLKNLVQTVDEMKASDFSQLIKTSQLEDKLSLDNYTVFAPDNDAVRDFTDSVMEANQVEFYIPEGKSRRRRQSMEGASMSDIVQSHLVKGIFEMGDMFNEQIVLSENKNSSIRINIYPSPRGERVITGNCAKLTSYNNYATNGIIHVVDKVMTPCTKSLGEFLNDDKFSMFKELLIKTDLFNKINEEGHMTLLAPTNKAFDKLSPGMNEKLLRGEACAESIIKNHVLPMTLCSVAVQGKTLAKNIDGEVISLERNNDDGKIFIGKSQLVKRDIMATNGVLHVIDEVVIPDSGNTVTNVLGEHNLTIFKSLMEEAGLIDSLDEMDNLTIFAPTNKALTTPEALANLENLKSDKNLLRDALLYHITSSKVESCDFVNDQLLKSKLNDQSIRLNLYSTLPIFSGAVTKVTAQCARIVNFDDKTCGGVVHEIDRLLVPPKNSILEQVQENENATIFAKIVKASEMELVLQEKTPITLLAPTDDAFSKLSDEDVEKLTQDKEMATKLVKQHIIPEVLCCAGVGMGSWPFENHVETLNGRHATVRRDHNGRIHIGGAVVTDCDQIATNGIIHSVNRVFFSNKRRGGNFDKIVLNRFKDPNVQVFLYGI